MPIFQLLVNSIRNAAMRAASDPRTRAKAEEIYDKEIKPRAAEAWKEAKPKVDAAVKTAGSRLKDNAIPVSDLKGFGARIREEFEKGKRGE